MPATNSSTTASAGSSTTPTDKATYFRTRWATLSDSQKATFAKSVREFAEVGNLHPMFPPGKAGQDLIKMYIVAISGASEAWWSERLPTLEDTEWTAEDGQGFLQRHML